MIRLAESEEAGRAAKLDCGPPIVSVPVTAKKESVRKHDRVVQRGII